MNAKSLGSRGQAPLENLFALVLLVIGIGGAWLLYGPQIQKTNEALVDGAKQIFGTKTDKPAR